MDYVECRDCGFVLQGEDSADPQPKHWDSCPGCDGSAFQVPDGESMVSPSSQQKNPS